jgi:nitroimidazol reductase NimA-like FMN-containing flavoprotein (pyridoxamine 5'-phosphate oxidase superfamily)
MKTRLISSDIEITEVIDKCEVCHVAMVDDENMPYVLPFNFGRIGNEIYLHSAPEGKKMRILRAKQDVCVAFSSDYHLRYVNEEVACSWSMKYKSILIYGKVEFIEDNDAKIEAMNLIMQKYAGKDFGYNMPAIREVCVYKVVVDHITGRAYGY